MPADNSMIYIHEDDLDKMLDMSGAPPNATPAPAASAAPFAAAQNRPPRSANVCRPSQLPEIPFLPSAMRLPAHLQQQFDGQQPQTSAASAPGATRPAPARQSLAKPTATSRAAKPRAVVRADSKQTPSASPQQPQSSAPPSAPHMRCGNCIACFRPTDCGKCEPCLKERPPCARRVCIQAAAASSRALEAAQPQPPPPKAASRKPRPPKTPVADDVKPAASATKSRAKAPTSRARPSTSRRESTSGSARTRAARKGSSNSKPSPTGYFVEDSKVARHCLGPGCIRAARGGSKYCGAECAQALAERRLALVLPERVRSYYAETPLTEVTTDVKLLQLVAKRTAIEEELKVADEYRQAFDLYVAALAHSTPANDDTAATEVAAKTTPGLDASTCFCFVCGTELTIASLSRHTLRCYERLEKQTSFGTAHKVRVNPYNILCEVFDKHSKTYCKRLRVVCPEHYKDDIGKKMAVCGYPLAWEHCALKSAAETLANMNQHLADGMCLRARAQCSEHKLWEQNIAALIDNLRMSYLLQIDDLLDTYRRLCALCQSHSNVFVHMLADTKCEEGAPPLADAVSVYIEDDTDDMAIADGE